MMNVIIRNASVLDAVKVNQIFGYYIENTLVNFGESNKSDEARAAEIQMLSELYPYLIAEDEEGKMLGFACAEPFRPQSGYRLTAETTIYLHPDTKKGTGIGTALYTRLLTELKQRGFHIAIAVLYAQNDQSIALHHKFGFQQTALLKEYGFKKEQWLDALLMEKRL